MTNAFDLTAALAASDAREAELCEHYENGEVEKGSHVRVFKGRKVPVGTTGKVFWIGASDWGGYRIGFNGDDDGETYWTAMDNVKVMVADKGSDESWSEYHDRKEAAAAFAAAHRVSQWDEVVILAEPEFVGKVFWMRDDRLGVARKGARRVRNAQGQLRNKPEDVRWLNADEVCKVEFYEPELAEVPEPEPEDSFDDDEMGCF
jgi:hypothetical protein